MSTARSPKRATASTPLDTALRFLGEGHWPIPIHPWNSKGQSPGKRPIGVNWGKEKPTVELLTSTYRRYPEAGVGLLLGPDGGLVDIDVDDPASAGAALARMFPDGEPETLGWANQDGRRHLLLRWHPQLADHGLSLVKGFLKPKGEVGGNPAYLGLEVRIGAADRQLQTVIPPSLMTNGQARRWNAHGTILDVPASLLADLDAFAKPKPIAPDATPGMILVATSGRRWTPAQRYAAWLAKVPGAVSGSGGHTQTLKAAMGGPGFDLTPGETLDILRADYNPRCEPQWLDKELQHKVDDAYKVETRRGWLLEVDDRPPATRRPTRPFRVVGDDGPREEGGDPQPGGEGSPAPRFTNYQGEGDGKAAHRVDDLGAQLTAIAPGWPKRVGVTLFVGGLDRGPTYIKSSPQFFAWIDKRAHVHWTKGSSFIPQERFFEHRRMTSERFDAVEVFPHWPPVNGIYYMHPEVPEATGRLGELVNMFCPSTDEDRELILAFILSMFWGGQPGQRPAFVFTGPDDDDQQGRGVGKSTAPQLLAHGLLDGFLEISSKSDFETVKTRLLSDGGSNRIVMLDNLKTLRFSSGELEGLITAPMVSGRALYVGEGKRPNLILWVFTVNGASMSKDLAQRSIIIKLGRPHYRPGWEADVREFIATHRGVILGEIRDTLMSDPTPLPTASRWATWERDVLSKVCRAMACQGLILARQKAVDDDNEERETVADYFRVALARCGVDPENHHAFISSAMAAKWVMKATNKMMSTNHASRLLGSLGLAEIRKSKADNVRGWHWYGPDSNPNACEVSTVIDPDENAPWKPSGSPTRDPAF